MNFKFLLNFVFLFLFFSIFVYSYSYSNSIFNISSLTVFDSLTISGFHVCLENESYCPNGLHSLSCSSNQVLKYDVNSSGWLCDNDDDLFSGLSCINGQILKDVGGGNWKCSYDSDVLPNVVCHANSYLLMNPYSIWNCEDIEPFWNLTDIGIYTNYAVNLGSFSRDYDLFIDGDFRLSHDNYYLVIDPDSPDILFDSNNYYEFDFMANGVDFDLFGDSDYLSFHSGDLTVRSNSDFFYAVCDSGSNEYLGLSFNDHNSLLYLSGNSSSLFSLSGDIEVGGGSNVNLGEIKVNTLKLSGANLEPLICNGDNCSTNGIGKYVNCFNDPLLNPCSSSLAGTMVYINRSLCANVGPKYKLLVCMSKTDDGKYYWYSLTGD